ncbi:cytochrome P450 6k1-like [Leptopilina heterotoma]|uniref:cytochrome P450 6k1-like n=1 Tax=Leptopilina heterotoma TaxID=63436 RepID=UPI001CA84D0A|nr:cytochrome P450 6k1-like [Leptopilina heterotoma]
MELLAILLVIIFKFFVLLTIYMSRNFCYWTKLGVKQITPFPFFGNFADYFFKNKSPSNIIKNYYDQHKKDPYVGIYIVDKPTLLIIDLNIIKSILVTNFLDFSDKFMKSSSKDPLSNRSLPFLEHAKWSVLRKKLTPAFSPSKLKTDFNYLKEVTQHLDKYLNSLNLEVAKTINVKEICGKYTTDLVGLIGFGLNLNSLNNPNAEFRKYGKMMFGDFTNRRKVELTSIYLSPSYIKNIFDYRFFEKESGEFFRKEFTKIFQIREESKIVRNDLLDILIEIKKEDSTLEMNDIIAQAIVLFTAGFDTTSTVMSFTLFELASNLEIQQKLRSEINKYLEKTSGVVTFDMVTTLPFLEKVVLETLRLHPTVPTIDRVATKDVVIQETGLRIKKGTPIIIPITGIHYDEHYFENPEIFNPDNFDSKNLAFMPFGIGPRSCIALRQGLNQAKFGIIYFVSNYMIRLSDKSSVQVDPKVYFTAGKEGLYLELQKI